MKRNFKSETCKALERNWARILEEDTEKNITVILEDTEKKY